MSDLILSTNWVHGGASVIQNGRLEISEPAGSATERSYYTVGKAYSYKIVIDEMTGTPTNGKVVIAGVEVWDKALGTGEFIGSVIPLFGRDLVVQYNVPSGHLYVGSIIVIDSSNDGGGYLGEGDYIPTKAKKEKKGKEGKVDKVKAARSGAADAIDSVLSVDDDEEALAAFLMVAG